MTTRLEVWEPQGDPGAAPQGWSHAPSSGSAASRDPPLLRPFPVCACSVRTAFPPSRVPAGARQTGRRVVVGGLTAFHTYVSGRGSCPKTSGLFSDTSRVQLPGSSVAGPVPELNSFELTKCGRYCRLTAEEHISNGETRQLLSLTGGYAVSEVTWSAPLPRRRGAESLGLAAASHRTPKALTGWSACAGPI